MNDVKVERKVDEMGVLLTLKTNPADEDSGQIIGRGGDIARAIRTLLRLVGRKNNTRVNLKIEESGQKPAGTKKPKASEDFKI